MHKGESFIAGRIRRAAAQHQLPSANCFNFGELDANGEPHQRILEAEHLGTPMLAFEASSADWTVIGTEGVTGYVDDAFIAVAYCDMAEIKGFDKAREYQLKKAELTDLPIKLVNGDVVVFRLPAGKEFFGFWSICGMLIRLSTANTN